MKILIDHQTFSMQKYGGISRYFANLNHGLNATPGISSSIATLYSENEYLSNEPFFLKNAIGSRLFAGKKDRMYKWNRRFSRWNVRKGNYDVFHPTYLDPYFIKYIKKPFVVTVHDMIYELYPELFDHTAQDIINRKKLLIEKASAVIAISEHTKSDIIKFYPKAESKITVVHHGYALSNSATNEPPLTLPKNYILFVGDRWHYKNFQPFVKAIRNLFHADASLNLICAGGGSFSKEELTLFNKLNIEQQCTQMSVTDAGLMQLYGQAKLFVFPSWQEGFGLPVLEAFANNCPVVCSNATSLPEVAGKAALYFDPMGPGTIRTAVEQVLNSTAIQKECIKRGRQQLSLFTFEACVQNTIKVYQSVL